jgi:hypothetical protein
MLEAIKNHRIAAIAVYLIEAAPRDLLFALSLLPPTQLQ